MVDVETGKVLIHREILCTAEGLLQSDLVVAAHRFSHAK